MHLQKLKEYLDIFILLFTETVISMILGATLTQDEEIAKTGMVHFLFHLFI